LCYYGYDYDYSTQGTDIKELIKHALCHSPSQVRNMAHVTKEAFEAFLNDV